jgi:hypothetical protein
MMGAPAILTTWLSSAFCTAPTPTTPQARLSARILTRDEQSVDRPYWTLGQSALPPVLTLFLSFSRNSLQPDECLRLAGRFTSLPTR